ncbi:MAG: hypothetical protein KA165_11575 [Saprospiraceae bacterium]|nr:hypothetical protein [Saprospiraceae bacterium]
MHLPESVPAIFILCGLIAAAHGLQMPLPPLVAPPEKRSNTFIYFGALLVAMGLITWYCERPASNAPTAGKNDCNNTQIIAPEVDLDMMAILEYPVELPAGMHNSIDSSFNSRQTINARQFAHDSVARVYGKRFGLSTLTLGSLAENLDSFITVYARRKCLDPGTGRCLYVVVIAYPLNPVGRIEALSPSFNMTLTPGAALTPENVRLPAGVRFEETDMTFEKSRYLLSGEQKLKMAIIAEALTRRIKAGRPVKIYCDGYSSTERVDPVNGISYGGPAYWCPGVTPIGLSETGKCSLIGPRILNNQALSYARAYEGISCLFSQMKDIDPKNPALHNIEWYYRGNGAVRDGNPLDKQRRITFTPIY